jgi:hypothetical protein
VASTTAFGWSLLELEIAFDVREGKISREKALEMIKNEKSAHSLPEECFDSVCAKLDMGTQELLEGLDVARRNIRNYRRLRKIKDLLKPDFKV